jgi:hypothetical protein
MKSIPIKTGQPIGSFLLSSDIYHRTMSWWYVDMPRLFHRARKDRCKFYFSSIYWIVTNETDSDNYFYLHIDETMTYLNRTVFITTHINRECLSSVGVVWCLLSLCLRMNSICSKGSIIEYSHCLSHRKCYPSLRIQIESSMSSPFHMQIDNKYGFNWSQLFYIGNADVLSMGHMCAYFSYVTTCLR